MKNKYYLIFFSFVFLIQTGCANFDKKLKAFLGGEEQPVSINPELKKDSFVKYSENKNIPVQDDREYHRITRKQFEDQELSQDRAGSLWVMEGQDSYLFTQNIVRLPGDILNVILDGQPEKQLATKASVIKSVTVKPPHQRAPANAQVVPPPATPTVAENPVAGTSSETESANPDFDVKTVPTRIIERMTDGSYRIKGSQSFMIGPREYRVIVTGLVKPSDIASDSVASSKMLDSKFDIIRLNKGGSL